MENFWEKEYKDFVPNVTIKFKKMNSLDVLDLADRNTRKDTDSKQFKLDCLKNVLWTKNGNDWFALMDDFGNSTLSEMPLPTMLDIFYEFRKVVCLPIFTESKTYQSLLALQEAVQEDGVKKHE